MEEQEKSFVLDGITLSKQANDETDRTHPSLNMGIPQYNALQDKHCKNYFRLKARHKSIKDDASVQADSMMGEVFDKFLRNSTAKHYLLDRKRLGTGNLYPYVFFSFGHYFAGYTRQIFGGHLSVPTAPPGVGYHGECGYRRNTFALRRRPSAFDYEGA